MSSRQLKDVLSSLNQLSEEGGQEGEDNNDDENDEQDDEEQEGETETTASKRNTAEGDAPTEQNAKKQRRS